MTKISVSEPPSAVGALEAYWASGLHPDSPASTVESNAANRLLVAARDAFSANGYKGTTTRDIAAGAGMSPAAMYIHYSSKQEMLFKLSLLGHQACLESLLMATKVNAGARKRLRAAVFDFTLWHAEHHVISRTIQYELQYLDDENYQQVAEVRRAIHGTIEDIIRDGVAGGDFAVGDIPMTTMAILSMAIDTVRWFPSRLMSDAAELASHYADLADRMVAGTG